MITISREHFNQFCYDIIGGETKLEVVTKQNGENVMLVVYGEVPIMSELKRTYPDEKKRFAKITKMIKHKDPRFHTCRYFIKNRVAEIDGGKISDVILTK